MLRSWSFLSCVVALLGSAAADPKPAPAPPALTAADCAPIVKKMWPVYTERMKKRGLKLRESEQPATVDRCREVVVKEPHEPQLTCLLHAPDDAAVRVCFDTWTPEAAAKPAKTEAQLQLDKLGKNLKTFYITTSTFPKGKAKQLPEKACCAQPDHKCAVTKAWEKDEVWETLDFKIGEANLFQYTFESDGKTAKATAVGDPACSGKPVTYTLEAKAVDGNPVITITEPK